MSQSHLPPAETTSSSTETEIEQSLIAWYRQLSVRERLRAASRSAATLERLARAAAADR